MDCPFDNPDEYVRDCSYPDRLAAAEEKVRRHELDKDTVEYWKDRAETSGARVKELEEARVASMCLWEMNLNQAECIKEQDAKITQLREGLEFYGDIGNYHLKWSDKEHRTMEIPVIDDEGTIARNTLERSRDRLESHGGDGESEERTGPDPDLFSPLKESLPAGKALKCGKGLLESKVIENLCTRLAAVEAKYERLSSLHDEISARDTKLITTLIEDKAAAEARVKELEVGSDG